MSEWRWCCQWKWNNNNILVARKFCRRQNVWSQHLFNYNLNCFTNELKAMKWAARTRNQHVANAIRLENKDKIFIALIFVTFFLKSVRSTRLVSRVLPKISTSKISKQHLQTNTWNIVLHKRPLFILSNSKIWIFSGCFSFEHRDDYHTMCRRTWLNSSLLPLGYFVK